MKNNTKILIANVIMLVIGIVMLLFGFNETTAPMSGMLTGLGSALSLSAVFWMIRVLYWYSPSRKDQYENRMKTQNIDLKDERKIMLRDKSGRAAYLIGLAVLVICILVFRVLHALNIYDIGRAFFIFTGVFVVFEYLLGIIIFNIMSKKL
ncbi:hypothetical protein [Sporolactobacillus terrae]|uniref:DUF2178 domain-containing protein n=1 Tax=Sporolactobacillus terrae TaxID=269673 RepID=A0A5K7X258_9BACL|nr:hypothetical protein [Sporolactobacillus terrae]BBN98036.1 hypothetical protein St703_07410 [Sporolactobacillus terrae]